MHKLNFTCSNGFKYNYKSILLNMRMYAFLLVPLVFAAKEPKGTFFKLVGSENSYIGEDADTRDLKLVPFDKAIAFNFQDMEDISTKRMTDEDGKNAFTEQGWWIFRKRFNMKSADRDSKQGFSIVWYRPNEYLLVRDGDCLSAASGTFKKVSCNKTEAQIFNMCSDKYCNDYTRLVPSMLTGIYSMLYSMAYSLGGASELPVKSHSKRSDDPPKIRNNEKEKCDDTFPHVFSFPKRKSRKRKFIPSSTSDSSDEDSGSAVFPGSNKILKKQLRSIARQMNSEGSESARADEDGFNPFGSGAHKPTFSENPCFSYC
ncbi:hypothetical protein ENBRE01_2399 [Enteropsectra breve]|nr:hypothetical protein ENBRE01_2399 [Enteropsectra breve]